METEALTLERNIQIRLPLTKREGLGHIKGSLWQQEEDQETEAVTACVRCVQMTADFR